MLHVNREKVTTVLERSLTASPESTLLAESYSSQLDSLSSDSLALQNRHVSFSPEMPHHADACNPVDTSGTLQQTFIADAAGNVDKYSWMYRESAKRKHFALIAQLYYQRSGTYPDGYLEFVRNNTPLPPGFLSRPIANIEHEVKKRGADPRRQSPLQAEHLHRYTKLMQQELTREIEERIGFAEDHSPSDASAPTLKRRRVEA